MMYPFLTLNDGTEIVHSEMQKDRTVRVFVELPTDDSFKNAYCILPEYRWEEINGFSEEEIKRYQHEIEKVEHLIMEFSMHGGFMNAANY